MTGEKTHSLGWVVKGLRQQGRKGRSGKAASERSERDARRG